MDIIIIPAYQPSEKLLKLIEEINKTNYEVIVVNDGSDNDKNVIFEKISSSKVTVLKHEKNLGKGRAIKTALQYIKKQKSECETIAIMDADGQHLLEDVEKLIQISKQNKTALIIGIREIGKSMPIKSRLGNLITRNIFQIVSGVYVHDTQTGLRVFNKKLIDELLSIEGERYEYETNMLLKCAREKIEIKEVQIHTIYYDKKNSSSHFRVLKDSFMIYKDLLKFSLVSISSFLLDYVLFRIFNSILSWHILLSNVIARVISSIFNYELNCKFVFKEKQTLKTIIQYFGLAIFILFMNNIILTIYTSIFNFPAKYGKILTEASLFIISFVVQKIVIFRKKTH